MTTINYYPEHQSGSTFEHKSNQEEDRVFGVPDNYDTFSLSVYSEFGDLPDCKSYFQLLGIDKFIDYLSFHSLN